MFSRPLVFSAFYFLSAAAILGFLFYEETFIIPRVAFAFVSTFSCIGALQSWDWMIDDILRKK